MTRKAWSGDEIADLEATLDDYESFRALHPNRSYDSWEVKRRRVRPEAAEHTDGENCWCRPLVIHVTG